MANPAPTINQINAFNATQGTTIDFNIIGGTELVRSNRIYIYDLSDNSLICTHLYVSTESIHELPPNTDGSIVYEDGKSSADFVNGAQYYAQIQTFTDIAGTEGGSGLSVAKMFWCLVDPTLTITTIPSTISTTSYNVSATYNANTSVVSNIIQQYQFNLYNATGSLLQSSGVVVGSGTQQGTSTTYDISYNFTGLSVGSSYYVVVDVTTTQGMSITTQSGTFTVSIDTPTLGEATVVNNACDGYISVTSNLSSEYGGSGSGEIVSFETDSVNNVTKLEVTLEPIQLGEGTPSPSNVRPISGHDEVDVSVVGKNLFDPSQSEQGYIDDADGVLKGISSVSMRSTGWIPVVSGETYFITSPQPTGQWGAWYDDNKTYISGFTNYSTAKTAPNNAKYLRVTVNSGGTNPDYATNVMVAKGNITSAYEPYNGQTYTQDIEATYTPTVQENEAYLFKQTGDVGGDRETIELVGGTVAWNQLIPNPTSHTTNTPMIVFNSGTRIVKGHRYIVAFNGKKTDESGSNVNAFWYVNENGENNPYSIAIGATRIITPTQTSTSNGSYNGNNNTWFYISNVSNATIYSFMCIDLTQMFGSTIADYIYTLEQGQAGAGVAWFRKLFPKPYYEYNAGELMSVNTSAHVTVGFNQWDEETELGYFDTNGTWTSGSWLSSKNPIPVVPNTTYYCNAPNACYVTFWKDAVPAGQSNASLITGSRSDVHGGTFTTPSNCRYIHFNMAGAYGTTYNHDICINLSWDGERDGEYEPYVEHSYPLDDSLTLRGIPKIANGKLYYDGDTYEADGTVTRRYAKVDLGSLSWSRGSNDIMFATFAGLKYVPADVVVNAICPKYTAITKNGFGTGVDKTFRSDNSATILYFKDSAYSDSSAFKTAMSGVYLVYELATPTTEFAEPFESIQKVTPNYGTEEFVTTSIVPVGNNTQYFTRDIYGGTLDLVSGVLTVTHGIVDLSGLTFSYTTNRAYINFEVAKLPPSTSELASCIAEQYQQVPANGTLVDGTFAVLYAGGHTRLYFYYDGVNRPTGNLVYELATPQTYQLTPQQIQTLVGVNNVWSEQGEIELSYHIPITNLLVKRQDVADVSGDWLTLYSQPITQASDMDFTFIDFTNQYGKTYKYALVPLLTQTQSGVEVEVEGGYTVSDEVQSVFDGVFIVDSTGSQKCKANVGYGNVDMNQTVGTITPIGAKYPVVITNSQNQYHNGSISGTIVPDDYYFNGNLSRVDMVNKRDELEQFLTNKRAKIIKDWNGNIWLVMIMDNVSCTFNNNYGMGIVNFNTNWVEVGDPTNQQDLQATGLINVGGV